MDADWSVELGEDDPVLEFPWTSDDGTCAYVDLKRRPENLREVPEARAFPKLADFLRVANEPASSLLTAKCDAWTDHDLGEAEQIYGAKLKFCSYVDLLFAEEDARSSFVKHEAFVKNVARALNAFASETASDDLPVAAEFIVRRCWYRPCESDEAVLPTEPCEGFYITFYLFGYGDDEAVARCRWSAGLKRVTPVLARFST